MGWVVVVVGRVGGGGVGWGGVGGGEAESGQPNEGDFFAAYRTIHVDYCKTLVFGVFLFLRLYDGIL